MKKLGLSFVALLTVASLAACGGGSGSDGDKDKKANSGKSDVASISIEEGEYIVPGKRQGDVEEGEGFLALKVKITNESDKSIDLATNDFMLYDEDDNKISIEDFYIDESAIKTLSYEKISSGKSKTGYVIFAVEKDEKYQLHYEPTIYDLEKELDPVVLDVNTEDYEDNSEEAVNAATAYIDEVFLATTNDKYNSLISNDRDEAVTGFDANFTKGIKNYFYNYKATDEEGASLAKAFRAANGEVAEVTYEVYSYFPDAAEVLINAEVLSFDEMEDEIDDLKSDYTSAHEDQDYSTRSQSAEKDVITKLPDLFKSSLPIEASTYGDGFTLVLKKKDDKWEVQTKSAYSTDYDSLEQAFRGGLYKR